MVKSGLIDGIVARPQFKDKAWQGYEGEDMYAEIIFDELKEISSVTLSMLENNNSWVFLPEEIMVEYSLDGKTYESFGKTDQSDFKKTEINNKFAGTISLGPIFVKSIKVNAKNIGLCPENHPGGGEPAWLFVDEIIVQ